MLVTNGFCATVVSKENAVEPGSGIIIPVQSLGKAYRALPSMFLSLAIIDKYESVTVLRMLVTMKGRTSFEAYVNEQVHQNYPGLAFDATIPWCISASYDEQHKAPLGVYNPKGDCRLAHKHCAEELVQHTTIPKHYRQLRNMTGTLLTTMREEMGQHRSVTFDEVEEAVHAS